MLGVAKLVRKIRRKSGAIASDGLVESLRCCPVNPGQILVQNHTPTADDENAAGQRVISF